MFADVIIAGAGPAGTATALALLQADPTLAGNIILLEKGIHPRPKTCAGGLIPHALDCLRELEIPLSVPHVRVERVIVRVPPGREVVCEDGGMCSVVRRDEFDSLLARTARERGAVLHEGEIVSDAVRETTGVRVTTDRAVYRARVLVGADGSGSRVRRCFFEKERQPAGKAIMTDIPVPETVWRAGRRDRYDINFLGVARGLRGYAWKFPCVIGATPHLNVGVYSIGGAFHSASRLRELLVQEVAETVGFQIPSAALRVRAFPIQGYDRRRPLAASRVLLVGDAAGAEPLMGEGISCALEYGRFAARAIQLALRRNRYEFSEYTSSIEQSWFGRKLARLSIATRLFYGRSYPVCFGLLARSRRLQSLGLQWYNGVDDRHERSGWAAIGALLRTTMQGR